MRRRLPRILLNTATVVSVAALGVAAAAVAVSDSPGDQPWEYVRGERLEPRLILTIATTQVSIERYVPAGLFIPSPVAGPGGSGSPVQWGVGGFEFDNRDCLTPALTAPGAPLYRCTGYRVVLPMWFVLASAAALPASRLGRRFQNARRRQRPGLCQNCGYDLRATPDRCPECGARAQLHPRRSDAYIPPPRAD